MTRAYMVSFRAAGAFFVHGSFSRILSGFTRGLVDGRRCKREVVG